MFLVYLDPLEKPFKLGRCDIPDLFFALWPEEFLVVQQGFGGQKEPVGIVTQSFHGSPFFITEKKKADRRIGIQVEPTLYQCRQTRYLFPEIRSSDGKIDMLHAIGDFSQHKLLSARSTSVSWEQAAVSPMRISKS